MRSSFILLTLPDVKYNQDEIKELDMNTSSQKVNHDKITVFDWPEGKGGGGRGGNHMVSMGKGEGGDLRKLTANERGGENRNNVTAP